MKLPFSQVGRALESALGKQIAAEIPAFIGNPVDNSVLVSDARRKGLVWVHGLGSEPEAAFPAICDLPTERLAFGAPVLVRRTSSGLRITARNPDHDAEFWDGANPHDQAPVYLSQLMYGTLHPTVPDASMRALVIGALYRTATGSFYVADQNTADFSASPLDTSGAAITVPTTNLKAKGVLVQLDAATGTLSYKQGAEFDAIWPHALAFAQGKYPSPDIGRFGTGYIRLVAGMTRITYDHLWIVPDLYSSAGNLGTVTSVGLTMPGEFSVSGSPITTAGILAVTWDSLPFICQGRLTLTSGTPITTADVSDATTLYFTPYEGTQVALYDGTKWKIYTFTERSIAVPSTRNTPYDVFLYDNAGVLTLELTAWNSPFEGTVTSISNASPPVVTFPGAEAGPSTDELYTISGNSVAANNATWRVGAITATTFELKNLDGTNPPAPGSVGTGGTRQFADQNTARATALTTQNGIYVKSGALTRRYLGTIRTTDHQSAGRVHDRMSARFVWNYYHRRARPLRRREPTGSWTYGAASLRVVRDDLNNRVECIIGVNEDPISILVYANAERSAGASNYASNVGLNSKTVGSAALRGGGPNDAAANIRYPALAFYDEWLSSVGFNVFYWLEIAQTGTATVYGNNINSGILAEVQG